MRLGTVTRLFCALTFGLGAPSASSQPQPPTEQSQNAQKPEPRQGEAKSSQGDPAPAERGDQPAKTGGEQQERHEGPVAYVLSWVVERIARFIEFADANDKAFVAIGTVVLAVFTIVLSIATVALWIATKGLVRGADKTAERQLRAYISIIRGDVQIDLEGFTIRANLQLSNSGQTPAYDTTSWANIVIADAGQSAYGELKDGDAKSIIGPSGEINLVRHLNLTETDKAGLLSGNKGVFLWGSVKYVDIFNQPRFFDFWAYSGNQYQTVRNASLQLTRIYPLYPDKRGYKAN